MLRAIVELLEAILHALSHGGDIFARMLPNILRLITEVFQAAALPEVLLLFGVAVFLTILLVFLQACCHLAISAKKGGRARVFISYQHDLKSTAQELAAALLQGSITPTLLPFISDPDHDELLDRIKNAIHQSDLVVCLPGSHPSFVENEVSMAFALNKPLLFVLDAAHRPRLPNTAKKCYPLFDLELLRRDHWLPITRFISYLAGDVRSTLHLYAAVFEHLKACAAFIVFAYGVSIVIGTGFVDASPATHSLSSSSSSFWSQAAARAMADPLTIWFILVSTSLFLIPYSVFFLTRYILRSELRHAVSCHRFDMRLLPNTLQYSLRRTDLKRVQFAQAAAPEHELDHQQPRGAIVVRLNRSKLVLHLLAIVGGLWVYLSAWGFFGDLFGWLMLGVLSFWGYIAALILIRYGTLVRRWMQGAQLLVSSEGIVDSLSNRPLGLVSWERVTDAKVNADNLELKLKLSDRNEPVVVDLTYYKVAPDVLFDLVREHLRAHRNSEISGCHAGRPPA